MEKNTRQYAIPDGEYVVEVLSDGYYEDATVNITVETFGSQSTAEDNQ